MTKKPMTIKELCHSKGFKVIELSKKLGVSVRTIHRWEKETSGITFKNVIRLSKAFDMSLDELAELLRPDLKK